MMNNEKTYWAVIDVSTNIVEMINVCIGDALTEMQERYPDKTIAQCKHDINTTCGIGFVFDTETGWFIPPRPDDDDPAIFFDREIWKWFIPEPPVIDTPEDEPEVAP